MKTEHCYDPNAKYVSSSLKKAIEFIGVSKLKSCIDLPCGNGRNTFYLANIFQKIIAVDINEAYLATINSYKERYSLSSNNIITLNVDLSSHIPSEVANADLVCSIHYYNYSSFKQIIESMKKGSFFYIETYNCNGGNYLQLPKEEEVETLLNGVSVLFKEQKLCGKGNIQDKRISFKCLIEK